MSTSQHDRRDRRAFFGGLSTLSISMAAALVACSASSTTDPPSSQSPNGSNGSSTSSSGGGSKGGTPKPGPADPAPDPDPLDGPECTGAAGSLYAITVKRLSIGDPVPLCRFQRKVLLVVNTASHCGYTPQYDPLEAVYTKYAAQGFAVLGFPSKSFNQEDSNETDVSNFCTMQYGITFPMFAIANVNAPDEQPVYTWLKSQPDQSADISWNFEKFLVGRDGKVAARFLSAVEPDSAEVSAAIEAELAKP